MGKTNEKLAKLAALILVNISMAPATKNLLLPYEKDIVIVAATDENISKILVGLLCEL